jgi:phage terminase large subunit-like protein
LSFQRKEGEALHRDRENLTKLAKIRRAVGELFFSAHFQQMPAPPGGSIVKTEWFQRYDPATIGPFETIVQSWDTASRVSQPSDYSVCTDWGKRGRQLFPLNVYRKKLEYPDLKRAIISQAQAFGANTVLIEDAASGIALIQDLEERWLLSGDCGQATGRQSHAHYWTDRRR